MSAGVSNHNQGRRLFLRVLGGSAAAVVCPLACSSDELQPGRTPDSGLTGGHTGDAAEASAGGFGAGGAGDAGAPGIGGAAQDGGTDVVLPPCSDPPLHAPGCENPPPGRAVGRPCDFAAFRLQAAPHDDLFQAALVGRDADGWYARSAVCTHMGCNLAVPDAMTPAGIVCPCHGSTFDHHGQVLTGPAVQNLRPVALALGCDGELYVDLDMTVAPELRLEY